MASSLCTPSPQLHNSIHKSHSPPGPAGPLFAELGPQSVEPRHRRRRRRRIGRKIGLANLKTCYRHTQYRTLTGVYDAIVSKAVASGVLV